MQGLANQITALRWDVGVIFAENLGMLDLTAQLCSPENKISKKPLWKNNV